MFDSLPYVDEEISTAQREAAVKVIERELATSSKQTLHPDLTQLPETRLSHLLRQEVLRAGVKKPIEGGIDLTRYEALEDVAPDSDVEVTKAALRMAFTNITYLRNRQMNISLLEEYGKNAWLISNSHLEEIQKRLQREVDRVKAESETMNRLRKTAQEESRGELLGLEETWKQGIGRIIDTQLATDQLQQQLNNVRG